MKRIFAVVLAVMLIAMSGCTSQETNKNTENKKLQTGEQEAAHKETEKEAGDETVSDNTSEDDSEASDRNLTEEEVIELCYEKYGNKDDVTGFEYAFICMEVLEENGEIYYAIDWKWLVDGSHFSTIDMFAVAAKNGEIYNLEYDEDMNLIICDSRGEML